MEEFKHNLIHIIFFQTAVSSLDLTTIFT